MYQCLGLGTHETGGCGEDWYHPGCLVGLGPKWYEKQKAHASGTNADSTNGNGTPKPSSSVDIFEEAKRKMLLREQEEKIPVFPTEPDINAANAAAAAAAAKKKEEEVPQMSATSYPGQEWNPYGDGNYEEWD